MTNSSVSMLLADLSASWQLDAGTRHDTGTAVSSYVWLADRLLG
ncbi:hypothetical protein [Kamptonema formosum]|nr:hypothetical protein [Oscillatoria sp. PCC 10802]